MSDSGEILIIADLHLAPANAAALGPLDRLIERAEKAKALYILGDLFDYWVGDDQPVDPAVAERLDRLGKLATPTFLQYGNRDFLIGDDLAGRIGATVLPDEQRLDVDGVSTLLTHGDQLCTDDVAYQAMRQQLRSPAFRCDFLSKPLPERIAIAEGLRARSKAESSTKAEDIMDVNADAVANLMQREGVSVLIHGHTHRPAIHRLDGGRIRAVTGDWGEQGWAIVLADGELRLERFASGGPVEVIDRVDLSAAQT